MLRVAAEWVIFVSYIIFDLVILAILILFAFHGLRRGLILSFFSLLSVLIALVGAILLSNLWTPSVAARLQPTLQPTVTSALESALPEAAVDTASSEGYLLLLLKDADLPFGLERYLSDVQDENIRENSAETSWIESLSAALSGKLANTIAQNGLFVLCFVLILILWNLLARALNLVAKLPGLHTLNKLGGFVFGVLRGTLLLFFCAWLVRWLWNDLIPSEAIEQSKLLHFFMTFNPLDYLEKI